MNNSEHIEVTSSDLLTEREVDQINHIKSCCLVRMKEILDGHVTPQRENYLRRLSNLVALHSHERASYTTLAEWLREDLELQHKLIQEKFGDKPNVG